MRIAVIEDNQSLANAIAFRLRDSGHAVDLLFDGDVADQFLADEGADLIVLDINLPRKNGLEIIQALRLRGKSTPVLLLSARSETADRVKGLDSGADDYLVKPFEMDELEARIRALSRRKNVEFEALEQLGPLSFNRGSRVLMHRGQVLELPRRELAVLECLLDRRGALVSKGHISDYVYGVGADVEVTAVEPHISRLRKRLSKYGLGIKAARGLGYMLVSEP